MVTLERLRELPLLDADVRDSTYLDTGIAVNHGTNAPAELQKALKRRTPRAVRARPTTGLLATPPDAPPLDLTGF